MKKTQFEWQADEDEELGETPRQAQSRPVSWWRPFALWLFLLLAVFSVLAYWTLERRQLRLEEDVRLGVISSFELQQEAIEQMDQELFALLLSRDDMAWRNKQKQLFGEGLILDRASFGFHAQLGRTSAPAVQLAPDWNRAVVSFEQEYSTLSESNSRDTMRLLHTVVYELQDSRWLQAPLDEEFWGEWQTDKGELLMLQYPQRDANLAQRIGHQLETELQAICSAQEQGRTAEPTICSRDELLFLKLSTDLSSMDALAQPTSPFFDGSGYHLPAPTLIGLPLDETGYQVFYDGYTRAIIEEFRSLTGTPIPLPDKSIRTLCFDFPSAGLHLFRYDIAQDTWIAELSDRAFYYLAAFPDDKGVVLQEEEIDSATTDRLYISRWQTGQESVLLEEDLVTFPFWLIGWAASNDQARLVLQGRSNNLASTEFALLDLSSCDDSGCEFRTLPGFPVWSPDGQHTLITVDSNIYLGDEAAQTRRSIGNGFNPFWLGPNTFAYVRFVVGELILTNQVVTGNTATDTQRILFDSDDLAGAAGIEELGEIFIKYVEVSPADPELLLVSASGVRKYPGEYFIFTYRLAGAGEQEAGDQIILHLRRKGVPGGNPVLLTPTGFPPFLVSPNGRWLVLSELNSDDSFTWTIHLHDLERNETQTLSDSIPVDPGRFPFLDWSDDGRWLAIADDGFFRLIAPEFDYERLVPHDYDRCFYTVWND